MRVHRAVDDPDRFRRERAAEMNKNAHSTENGSYKELPHRCLRSLKYRTHSLAIIQSKSANVNEESEAIGVPERWSIGKPETRDLKLEIACATRA